MPDDEDILARRAVAIATALAVSGPGEKAAARRMDENGSPVFWRQVARLGLSPDEEPRWLRFTRLVALLTPASATRSIHDKDRPLGAALAEAGFSEQRLARLLAARGDARLDMLERAIRMLARKDRRLDVVSLARVVLRADRRWLARRYYEKLDRSSTTEGADHA